METKVIGFANYKGGVGRTTSVAAIGELLSRYFEKKVLLVDACGNANLSSMFRGVGHNSPTISDYLNNELDVIHHERGAVVLDPLDFCAPAMIDKNMQKRFMNLDIMCSGGHTTAAYTRMWKEYNDARGIIRRMFGFLKASGKYDYILVDIPSHFDQVSGFEVMCGLDCLVLPMTPNRLAYTGANTAGCMLTEANKYLHKNFSRTIDFLGGFVNRHSPRTKEGRMVQSSNERYWGDNHMFSVMIRDSHEVMEAEGQFWPVTYYKPYSEVSQNYLALTTEMLAAITRSEASVA